MKNYELEKFRKLNCCLCKQSFYAKNNYAWVMSNNKKIKDICDKCLNKCMKKNTNDTGCR